jgi:hypothetical protein
VFTTARNAWHRCLDDGRAKWGGQSLEEVLVEITSRLGDDQRAHLKLQTTVGSSLGSTLLGALSMRFDETLARSTLSFFDITTIPAIRSNIPGVTDIRFRSNLSGLSPVPLDALRLRSATLKRLTHSECELVHKYQSAIYVPSSRRSGARHGAFTPRFSGHPTRTIEPAVSYRCVTTWETITRAAGEWRAGSVPLAA